MQVCFRAWDALAYVPHGRCGKRIVTAALTDSTATGGSNEPFEESTQDESKMSHVKAHMNDAMWG